MDVLTSLFLLVFTISLLSIAKTIRRSNSLLPPGPFRFPIVGNLHQLGAKPHKSLAKIAETYGPIMSLKLGQITTIVISSAPAARLVLQKQDKIFANRTVPDSVHACGHNQASVVWKPLSHEWRELRKICSSEIFCSSKIDAYAGLRELKVNEMIASVEKSCSRGEAVLIAEAGFRTSMNMLSSLILSIDMAGASSQAAREFKENFWGMMELIGMPNLSDYYPWLRSFDPQRIRTRLTLLFGKMLSFVDSIIDERLAQRAERGSVVENRDVLDTLLNLMLESNGEFTRNDINNLILDLIVAGTDTTSSTLEWAMTELLRHPEILNKAKAELEQVINKRGTIQDADISCLPYLQAIVKETLRLHPAAPLLLPRKALYEVPLSGFTIPKDAQIIVNAWAIGRDHTIWDDPHCFKPDRFLGSDIDFKGANFELIPFGGGRRICPGLPLASKVIHLMLGSLLNSFDWKLEHGHDPKDIDMDDKFGLTLQKTQPLRALPVRI